MIKIALTNLGKYNEGELVLEWVTLPATQDEIDAALEAIGIDGEEYEEYFITDYEAPFEIGEYMNLDRLNELAEELERIDIPDAIFAGTYDAGDVIDFAYELESRGFVSNASEYVYNIVSDDELDELTLQQAQERGWQGVALFLGGIDYMNDNYYLINGYGNAENLTSEYLDGIVSDLMDELIRELDK